MKSRVSRVEFGLDSVGGQEIAYEITNTQGGPGLSPAGVIASARAQMRLRDSTAGSFLIPDAPQVGRRIAILEENEPSPAPLVTNL